MSRDSCLSAPYKLLCVPMYDVERVSPAVPDQVCCQCSSLLFHLSSRPLLRVQKVNPLLYIHIQDLGEVEALRRDILQMKKYLVECKIARDLQLLHKVRLKKFYALMPNFLSPLSILLPPPSFLPFASLTPPPFSFCLPPSLPPSLPSLPPCQLDVFPNFKEDASLLTLHEMVEIQNGSLLPTLKDIHRCFAYHITRDCQVHAPCSTVCLGSMIG